MEISHCTLHSVTFYRSTSAHSRISATRSFHVHTPQVKITNYTMVVRVASNDYIENKYRVTWFNQGLFNCLELFVEEQDERRK